MYYSTIKHRPQVGFTFLGILHWTVLLPASLLSAQNINYMLSPPKGPLHTVGKLYYRSAQTPLVLVWQALPGQNPNPSS